MATITTITKELEIPTGVFAEVAEMLLDHDLTNTLMAADKEADTVTLEISYLKEDRQAMHDIEDVINDYDEDEEDEDEEE